MTDLDVVTVVSNAATLPKAVARMKALESGARMVPFGRDACVKFWASEDVPDGYMRVWWGDSESFQETRVLDGQVAIEAARALLYPCDRARPKVFVGLL